MGSSGACRKYIVARCPCCYIPQRMDSCKFVHALVCAIWHKVRVLLIRLWPHSWASAGVCQSKVVFFGNLSIIHAELHEEVLTPSTILPPLTTVDVVRLELLQEPSHTRLADTLKIAEVAHKNLVACINVCSGRCLRVITQAALE